MLKRIIIPKVHMRAMFHSKALNMKTPYNVMNGFPQSNPSRKYNKGVSCDNTYGLPCNIWSE